MSDPNVNEAARPISGAALMAKATELITNPETGNTYRVRRADWADLIEVDDIPENFVGEALIRIYNREAEAIAQARADADTEVEPPAEVEPQPVRDEVLRDREIMRRAWVTASLVSPRVVKEPKADDEVTYKAIPLSDRIFIDNWARRRAVDATVKTDNGAREVKVSDLRNFPAESEHGGGAGAGGDAAGERPEPVAAVGD
jgi:hypothetical protein